MTKRLSVALWATMIFGLACLTWVFNEALALFSVTAEAQPSTPAANDASPRGAADGGVLTLEDDGLSLPEDMANPETGEAGTWIPRWAEREHVITEHKLQMCLKDTELADLDLSAMADKILNLEIALDDLGKAKDTLLVENTALTQTNDLDRQKLERRMRAVWGLGAIAVFATGAVAGVVVLR